MNKSLLLSLSLVSFLPLASYADQNLAGNVTVTGGSTTGNLNVTGSLDVDGPVVSFGTIGTSTVGNSLIFSDSTATSGTTGDTLTFSANRTTASWLWLHNASKSAMRLNSLHQLLLYQADGSTAGITLTPVSNQISFGSATLTGSGANLTAGGALTVTGALTASSGITNTNGTLTGGAAGLNLSAGGTNQNVTITPSGTGNTILNGNVGIGTTAPNTRLSVAGLADFGSATYASNGNATTGIILNANSGGIGMASTGIEFGGSGVAHANLLWKPNERQFIFGTGNFPTDLSSPYGNVNLTVSGNVGIGTTAPNGLLTLRNGNQELNFLTNQRLTGVWPPVVEPTTMTIQSSGSSAGVLAFASGNTEAMRISIGGNVGIGTPSPAYKLDVNGAIRSMGDRQITLDGGTSMIFGQGNTGGWAFGYHAKGSSGTDRGGFGFFGSADALSYYYVGSAWNTPTVIIQPNNGNVGIGTTNPASKLDVVGQGQFSVDGVGADTVTYGTLGITRAASASTLSYLAMTRSANVVKAIGIDASNRWVFGLPTAGTQTITTPQMVIEQTGNVGIGTTNPTQKLSVAGTIRAYAVVVDTGWSDYVFDKNYRLAPLSEVEQHIKAEKHLPGIPSAAEVAEYGVSLGDMQSKLLAKVEELTLHLIAQEKQMSVQQSEIAALRQQVSDLKAFSAPR